MASVRGPRGVFGDGTSAARPRSAVVEEIEPSYAWTEDSNGHYLLIDLPDFVKEEVKVQIDSSRHIKVIGESRISENKRIRFEQTFKIPEKSHTDAIKAKFDSEERILYITIPKFEVEEKREPKPEPEPEPKPKPKPEPEPSGLTDEHNANAVGQEIVDQKPGSDEAKGKDNDARGRDHGCEAKEEACKGQKDVPTGSFSEENVGRSECEPSYLRSAIQMLAKNKGIVVTAVLAFSLGMLISRNFDSDIGE